MSGASRLVASVADERASGVRRRWWQAVVVLLMAMLARPDVGKAGLDAGTGPAASSAGVAGSLASAMAWTAARKHAADQRSKRAVALASARMAALAAAEAELAAAAERDAGLRAEHRALRLARDLARATREERRAAARRLEGAAAVGTAALALGARQDDATARRERSRLLRAAAGGVVAPWAEQLGQANVLDREVAELEERERDLDVRLEESGLELRRLAATGSGARRLALDARREVTDASARLRVLARRLDSLAARGRLAVGVPGLERAATPFRVMTAERSVVPGLRRASMSDSGGRRGLLLNAAARASPRRQGGPSASALVAFAPAAVPTSAVPGSSTGVPVGADIAAGSLAISPIVGRWTEPGDGPGGARSRGGLVLETTVAQTVSAPSAGSVAFAGAFRGFGLLLIIDRGDGYHTLLSGLSRLDVARGATVAAGQAVGVVGVGDGMARLYVELRHHGAPVDPAGWTASREDRIRG